MIAFVDSAAKKEKLIELLLHCDPLHAAMIFTPLSALGTENHRLASFWMLYSEGVPLAALCRWDGDFFVAEDTEVALSGTAFAELWEFLRFLGAACICGGGALLERLAGPLSMEVADGCPVLRLDSPAPPLAPSARRVLEDFRPVFQLIRDHYGGFSVESGYEHWLSLQRLRERDGVCGVFALYRDTLPIATATITAASPLFGDIGSVVVHRDYRGKGLGRQLVWELSHKLQKGGRTPLVCAANPPLVDYYKALGFLPFQRWGVLCCIGAPPQTPSGPCPGTPSGLCPGTPSGLCPGTPSGLCPGTPSGLCPGTPLGVGAHPQTPPRSKGEIGRTASGSVVGGKATNG